MLSVGLQVNPNSYYSLHGKKIEYLFEESPEYLEFDQNASSSSMVKYELHYLEDADWDVYYLYDGPVIDGIPNGVGTYYWTLTNYYVGDMVDGRFEGQGKMIYDEYEYHQRSG